jgi:hypothetical protein
MEPVHFMLAGVAFMAISFVADVARFIYEGSGPSRSRPVISPEVVIDGLRFVSRYATVVGLGLFMAGALAYMTWELAP